MSRLLSAIDVNELKPFHLQVYEVDSSIPWVYEVDSSIPWVYEVDSSIFEFERIHCWK